MINFVVGFIVLYFCYILMVLFINKQKKTNELVKITYVPPIDIVFNVDNFNKWFINKNNNAVYCHIGIYLRCDKLSESMIIDYLEKVFNIKNPAFLWEHHLSHILISNFYNDIRKDWLKQLEEKNN